MNFSASAHPENKPAKRIESLRDWWSLAGVDLHYEEQPSALFADQKPTQAQQDLLVSAVTETKSSVRKEAIFPEQYPEAFDSFREWLSNPQNLIETGWSKNIAPPVGSVDPQIMVISALPDSNGDNSDALFNNKNQTLLNNMLAAIGCDSPKAYFASLAMARPADGNLHEKYWEAVRDRMFHHITLVKPKHIIILGDTASRIFFDSDLLSARKKKQYINHVSSNTEAIATFHPRILIERPEFKAEAWKDLQLLTRTPAP